MVNSEKKEEPKRTLYFIIYYYRKGNNEKKKTIIFNQNEMELQNIFIKINEDNNDIKEFIKVINKS